MRATSEKSGVEITEVHADRGEKFPQMNVTIGNDVNHFPIDIDVDQRPEHHRDSILFTAKWGQVTIMINNDVGVSREYMEQIMINHF